MLTKQDFKQLHKQFKYLESKIKEHDRIVVFRHTSPDFDALGSQMGLVTWIKDNFPNKEVHFVGDTHPTMMPDLFPYPEDNLSAEFLQKRFLALTTDVSNLPRLAGKEYLPYAMEIIKIDHHPIPVQEDQRFGDFLIVYPERPAAAEIIALFALSRSKKMKLSKLAARYMYTGIVGDTSRFLYQDTDGATLRIAADLLDTGIDKTAIYDEMYKTDVRRMNILRYVLNNYTLTDKGTCYYILDKKTQEELNMTTDEGNLHINTFRNMDGVRVVFSVTWHEEKNEYRVSLRSGHMVVAHVAEKYGGGGHDFAAGCRLKSLDELPNLVADLDALDDVKDRR